MSSTPPTTTTDPGAEPSDPQSADKPAGGIHSPFRIPILVGLIVSAAGAFFMQPRVVAMVRAEQLPALAVIAAPAAFAVVVVLAAIDAWRVARRRGHFRGPSVVMLAACVAFLGLLLPNTFEEYRARTSPPADSVDHYEHLFRSPDSRVRAVVIEAAGFRPGPVEPVASLLLRGLDDADPLVSRAALKAAEHKSGSAFDGDKDTAKAWLLPFVGR